MNKKNAKKQTKGVSKKQKGFVVNYPVGDFLIKVKNSALAKRHIVEVNSTNLVKAVAYALKKEGFVDEVTTSDDKISVRLTYFKKEPLMIDLHLVSKPGLRIYMNVENLKKRKKPTRLIISTSKGVMSDKDAVKINLGGEVIAEIL